MKTAQQINQSFRKQIRNRQKQQYFQNIRNRFKQIQQTTLKQKIHGQMQVQSSNITHQFNPDSQMYLRNLAQQIRGNNTQKMCNKIIDEGMHHQLLANLKKNYHVQATLQVISAIIGKQKIKVSNKFIRIGLIDELIRQSDYKNGNSILSLCMNILANIVFQNIQYGEMLLQNKIHKHLFCLGQKVIIQNTKFDESDQSAGFYIIWALAALLEIESTQNYKEQFLQILQFSLEIAKRQLYPKMIIDITFLVGYSFREQTQLLATPVINSYLNQIPTNCPYLQPLLILIKLLSPFSVNYSKISTIIMTCQNKMLSYCIRILQKICLVYPEAIPRNIQWWQRLYLKIIKQDDMEYYVSLMNKCKIKAQWIYGIINQILQKNPMCLTLINETLLFINSLLQKSQSPQQKKKVKFYLKSSNIGQRLEKLYENKNTEVSRKSQYLLSVLNLDFKI